MNTKVKKKNKIAVTISILCILLIVAGIYIKKEQMKKDPFEAVTVSYSGYSPLLQAELTVSDTELGEQEFALSKNCNISSGETLTLMLVNNEKYYAKNYGYLVTATAKEIVCDVQDAYVNSYDEISEEQLAYMKKQAKIYANRTLNHDIGRGYFSKLTYMGAGFMRVKDKVRESEYDTWINANKKGEELAYDESWSNMFAYPGTNNYNQMFLVFSTDIKSYYGMDTTKVYLPVFCPNIIKKADGTYEFDELGMYIAGSTNVATGLYTTLAGYENIQDVILELFYDMRSHYQYELTDQLEAIDISTNEIAASAEPEYIFADSDSRYIKKKELKDLSKDECLWALNELYARHGRIFQDENLQAHFNACSWYEGTISKEDFSENVFNHYEKKNRDTIVSYMTEKGWR